MIVQRIQNKLLDAYYLVKSIYDVSPYGLDTQSYWVRRQELFSRFGSGIQTDAEGLYSVTPEIIASRIAHAIGAQTVLDAFCGVGGMALGLAEVSQRVIAVDKNLARLEMARHNAGIYGVEDKIEFLHTDAFLVLETVQAEAVFLDPPWGGPGYSKLKTFGLRDFSLDCVRLLELAFKHFSRVVLLVPKQFRLQELEQFGKTYTVQDNYIRSKLYSRTVYFD